jgi:hypothetical protein
MRYIVVLRGTNVIGAKDSAFILLRLRRNSPGLAVREIHPEGWGLPASSFAIPRVKMSRRNSLYSRLCRSQSRRCRRCFGMRSSSQGDHAPNHECDVKQYPRQKADSI